MSLTRKVAANTAAQIIGRVIGIGLSLVSVGVLTRYLGPSEYGNYSIAFLYATIATTLADFGIYSIGLREMSSRPDEAYRIAGLTITVKTATQSLLFALIVLISFVLPYSMEVKLAVALALLGGLIATYISSFNLYFQYHLKLYLVAISDLVVKAISLGLILWLVVRHASLLTIVAANPIAMLIGLVISLALLLAQRYPLKLSYNKTDAKALLKQSIPLGIVTILGYLHFRIDTIILSILKTSYDVGIYAVSYKVIEIIVVLPTLFTGTIFPILSRYHADNDPKFQPGIQRSFNFLALLGMPLLFGIIATARPIIHFIAGPAFSSAVLPLQILMVAVFFSYINNLLGNLAVILNLQKKIVWITSSMLLLNIVLNIILIHWFSYRGAAITTVVTESINCYLMWRLVHSHLSFKISFSGISRILIASLIMFVAASYLSHIGFNLFVTVAVAGVIFAVAAIGFKAVTVQDLKELVKA